MESSPLCSGKCTKVTTGSGYLYAVCFAFYIVAASHGRRAGNGCTRVSLAIPIRNSVYVD